MGPDSQSAGGSTVVEADEELLRLLAVLVPGWTVLFVIASVALVLYGDLLMALFT